VDTTGAGDSFAGALAAALAAGADEAEALRLAVVAGGEACGWTGAQGWRL
jgi:ribokinase